MAPRAKLQGNFDVDYVITYRFTDTGEVLGSGLEGFANSSVLFKIKVRRKRAWSIF